MRAHLGQRLAQLEAAQGGHGGVHVFQVPRNLKAEALARWKAGTAAGIPEAATVVWVERRAAEMRR